MRIGVVVDGRSEVDGLKILLRRIDTPDESVGVIKADFHPESTPRRIAEEVNKANTKLSRRRLDRLIVLLDLERHPECPGQRATTIRSEIIRRLRSAPAIDVDVIVKVARLENWLVADPDCFSELRGLIPRADQIAAAVRPDRADHVDALALLHRASPQGRSYDKRHGAVEICKRLDPGRAAQNSRSFRRFLRVLGDSRYQDQSRLPLPHAAG